MLKRRATAVWRGNGTEGKGTLDGPSGVLKQTPYSADARFKNEDGKQGTNPEELIAAAHAGCFSMALSFQLAAAGITAEELRTTAVIDMEKKEGGWEMTGIELQLEAKAPGLDDATLQDLANKAKSGCPVSKALKAVPIKLNAKLVK
jgi:lipoyl-dependent peroxiredoxin